MAPGDLVVMDPRLERNGPFSIPRQSTSKVFYYSSRRKCVSHDDLLLVLAREVDEVLVLMPSGHTGWLRSEALMVVSSALDRA